MLQDTGFQGVSVEGVSIIQPKKKPKGVELTDDEKLKNQQISRVRVRIEHIIRSVKIDRIVKDKFRNWLKGFKDKVMKLHVDYIILSCNFVLGNLLKLILNDLIILKPCRKMIFNAL